MNLSGILSEEICLDVLPKVSLSRILSLFVTLKLVRNLLAQGTFLTAAMNQAIPTRALLQRVLSPHFGAIEARVQTPTTSKTGN